MKKIYFLLLAILCAASINAQTILISPTGDGGFENGATFAANGWTVVNGATNQWFVGAVAIPSAGTNSAYISDNVTGATHNYLNSSASTVHFYRDVTFPAGETNIVLTFKWKGQGEGNYDYVTVYSMPTSVTPVFNSPAGAFQSWLNIPTVYAGAVIHATPPNLNLQAAYQTQTVCLPAAYAGTTRRLVFMWSNDGSLGTQPPGSIDEISLVTGLPPTTPANQPTGLVLTASSPSQINGSYTAAAGSPDGYLVVRYPSGASAVNPINGTTYTAGNSLGTGKVVSAGAGISFSATGLTPNTAYDFYVYSYNSAPCTGGPLYRTSTPLFGSQTTLTCSGLAAGTYSVGPTGTYATLTAANAALAGGTTGPVIFELQSTYTSAGEPSFPVTFGATPCPFTGGVTIRPQSGAAGLSITSASATGTINFDGGSNITIDGRAGGTGPSQLSISNTSVTGYAIQFINSASSNTIKYCTVAGVNTGAASGVIFFNNAVGLATGNSNNTIDNCDIKDGATTPTNLVYASGNTTDYASGNNNNTISNCTIHDWFNAASTTASAAINIVGGASDWTITGNSFYQSVTRTFTMTTATDEGAIFITTTFGYNFTVTNNFIGGTAPLCGGTAWTWTGGATGTPTPRMIRLTAVLGPFSNISNNTIANLAITTSSTSTSTALIQHLTGNVNINNNTIGSQTATGNITFVLAATSTAPFFVPIGFGYGATPATINVTNNNVGGITVSTSSTGTVSFRVMYGQPVAGSVITITGNNLGGTVANSIQQLTGGATAGNGSLFGILMLNPSIGNVISNNTIRNLTINTATAGPSLTGINVQASGGGHTIAGNTIFNLTSNATNIAINNAASVVGLTMTGSVVGGTNVSGNTIYNLTNTNTTVAGWINGMYFATGVVPQPNSIISKNFIHSINLASATGGMAGIFFPNTGNGMIYNNMIRLGIDATGASITLPLQINGIYKPSTGSTGIYFNTVYIGGTGVASGAVNTYAFRRSASGPADTLMNNIFYNARSNASGTGKHYAINLNASTAILSNYNDLIANGTGGVLGINVATDYATIGAWRTATNLDWSSVSSDPQLLNPGGNSATVDLHINPAIASAVEQGGQALAQVADDIDAQSRAGFTPTDIGADAGNFTLLDQTPPVITFTPFTSTCNTGDRTLSGVTIADATGVPTAGALRPRIYYRKNAGAYFSQPGTLTSGSGTNGVWDFTIVAADMGGLVATDVVSYYIIAQDNLGNVASNAAGVVATDVNTITTPPASPNTYTVIGTSLSGNYNVGAGQTYTTLTAAVAAYNTACLTGPVTFSLTDALYSAAETFPITINANPFASAINTLTIKPTLAATSISGTSATGLIVLNGADWVTINGSITSAVNTICPPVTASRDLTITNTNVSTTSAVIWLQSTAALDGATNNSIRNINIAGSGNTQTLIGAGSGSTTISTASLGVNNHNNSYINNNVSKTQYGIFSQGSSLGAKNNGTVINQNLINTVAPNNTARGGIVVGFENNISISGNNISEISLASSPDVFGIAAGGISITTTAFAGNEVTNAVISKNIIGSVRNTGNSFSACGIFLATALSGTNLIINNTISGVSGNPTPGDLSVGMLLGGGLGSVTQVYNNTIAMTNVNPLASGTSPSYALAIGGANPVVDMRNNIISNTQNNGTGNNYAVGYGYTPFTNLTSDHNDYYVASGPTFFIGGTAILSTPTNQTTLANLQSVTTKDGAAQNVLPVFVSTTDLHLSGAAGANWCLNGAGVSIAAVTDDIDCSARSNPPDIGADDFNISGDAAATPASQTACSGIAITAISYTGSGSTFTWTRDNVATVTGIAASGTGNITGTLTNTTFAPITVTFTITPANAAGCTGPSFTATVLVNPSPNAIATPSSQTVCSGIPITTIVLTSSASGTTYTWTRDNTGTVTGIAASGAGNINGTLTNTTFAPITVTFTITPSANGCTGTTTTATVLVNPTPNAIATPSSQTACSGVPFTMIALTSSAAGTLYLWTRDNAATVTGLAASGSGNIGGTLTNTTFAPITVTFTITPLANGCTGPSITATILVNPSPNAIATPSSQSICSGSGITPIVLTSSASGTTYTWARNNTVTVTGIAASGAGNISGTLTNTTAAPVLVTFTITPSANGCTGPTSTATVLVNVPAAISGAITEPSTCVSADGAITLTLTGSGPYTFAWTGTGVNPTAQNQTGLAVGLYGVTVTDANGCISTASYTLLGPGGCTICPTMGSLTTTPAASTCLNQNTTITVSGLTNMGITFGITFKYSLVPLANPYAGGTVIATVPNGGLTSGGTVATTNTSFAATGTYYLYAILSPVPLDPLCRPASTATLVVNPLPTITPGIITAVCSGTTSAQLPYTATQAPTTYSIVWSAAALGQGFVNVNNSALPASPVTLVVPAAATPGTYTGTISVTNGNGCTSVTPQSFSVTINPIPTVNVVANQTVCVGTTTTTTFTGTPAGVVFNWTNTNPAIGLGAGGTGNISFVSTNATAAPITGTVTVTPTYTNGGITCSGTPRTFTITVNPTPTVNAVANQTVCNGALTAAVTFTGAVAGTVYNWANNNATIGLAASGTGNIASFTATNATNAPVTATITVTPSYTNGGTTCTGTATTFTITVNPTPTVNAVANQTVCNGAATTAVTFTGAVTGTVYNWTNNNASIGLAASGTGNIASFTAINATNAPVTATITVTPTASGCPGTAITFTITVNPTPTVNAVANQALCNGSPTTAVTFSGAVTGTVYNWTNSTTSIGLVASGTGNIASFTAVNATGAPVTATITVTPTANGCTGTPVSFTITVNPTPTVNAVASQAVCNGSATTAVTFSGAVAGTVYSWTNNNTSIGLAASGTGNIASFTAINNTGAAITATITVTPTYTNGGVSCTGASTSFTITVNPLPNIIFTNTPPRVCLTDTLVTLRATPAGGTWSGTGVTGSVFSAVAAGTGVATLTYTYTNTNGCTSSSFVNITVNDCIERHNVFIGAIRIYPNPSSGQFNIRFLSDVYKEFNVRVITASGQEMKSYHFSGLIYGSVIPMDLRILAAGTYFLEVYNEKERAHFPFVIAR